MATNGASNTPTSTPSLFSQITGGISSVGQWLGLLPSGSAKRKPDETKNDRKRRAPTENDSTPSAMEIDEAPNDPQGSAPEAGDTATAMQACFRNPMILVHILRFAKNPSASRVSINFYNHQMEILRCDYNQNKESHRPHFYYDEDKGSNEATAKQQVEVEYLLNHEADILKKTENAEEVKACFEKLKRDEFKNIQPFETVKFIAREKFLDELNAAIINVNIAKSQRGVAATTLDCSECNLTRFPGKVIAQHLDYFKALQELNLRINQLQGLPPEIGQLVALQKLFVYSNQLQSLPDTIGQLVALQRLYLNNNKLQSLPDTIGQLAALQWLLLSHNQLQSLPPTIGRLAALKELNLSNNQFQSLPDTIGQLVALKGLSLSNNQLQSLPDTIGQLAALQVLYLSNNQLQSLPDTIGRLAALKKLFVYSNQLQSLPDTIGRLAALQELFLSSNQLQGLPDTIGQLAALKELNLSNNQLQSLPDTIGRLAALQQLFLNSNQLLILPDSLRESILRGDSYAPVTKAQVLASQKKPISSDNSSQQAAAMDVDGAEEHSPRLRAL